VLLNDAIGNCQSEARAFPDFFCRVKRLEHTRQRRCGYTRPGVANLHDDVLAIGVLEHGRGCFNAAAVGADGLLGIQHDVQQRLLQQQRIPLHARQRIGMTPHHLDVRGTKSRRPQGQHT